MALPVCVFVDEYLTFNNAFVGAVTVVNPPSLQGILFRARVAQLRSSREEVKWTNLTPFKYPMAQEIVRNFFWYRGIRLYLKSIPGNRREDVEMGVMELLRRIQVDSRIVAIFMDWYDHGPGYNFDNIIKAWFSPTVVLRLDSRSADLLQLLDIVFNCEVYNRKVITNQTKLDLLQYYDQQKNKYRSPSKIIMT